MDYACGVRESCAPFRAGSSAPNKCAYVADPGPLIPWHRRSPIPQTYSKDSQRPWYRSVHRSSDPARRYRRSGANKARRPGIWEIRR